MPTQKNDFRDFVLLELSHLPTVDFELLTDEVCAQGRQLIQQRLEFGRKVIVSETKPEDLVLIESLQESTFEDFKKITSLRTTKKIPEQKIKWLWENFYKYHLNFYFELAQYARQKGRKVAPIVGWVRSPKSRLVRASTRLMEFPEEKARRIYYLMSGRTDISMQRRIENRRPALAIVGGAHAAYLEHSMNPKKTIWQEPMLAHPSRKIPFLEQRKRERLEYEAEKRVRRQRALRLRKH